MGGDTKPPLQWKKNLFLSVEGQPARPGVLAVAQPQAGCRLEWAEAFRRAALDTGVMPED